MGMDGPVQPRVAFLKLDEDCFSSNSEDRMTLKMPHPENMPLIASGKEYSWRSLPLTHCSCEHLAPKSSRSCSIQP